MSLEANKELTRRFHNCNLDDYDVLLSEDFIGHDILGHTWDREFQMVFLTADIASFAGLHDSIHDIVAEGDKVVVRFTRSGVFRAKFEDYEPTNKKVHFPIMELICISEGKIVELWGYNDDTQVVRILRGEQS